MRFRHVSALLLGFVLAGCNGDHAMTPDGGGGYAREDMYPIANGYSWTYVQLDTLGIVRDTVTVVVQADSVDGNSHFITKCWLEEAGLCPMAELVTPEAVQVDTPIGPCDVLRFPLSPGRSWACGDVLVRVARTEDLQLRTGRSFPGAVAVEFLNVRTVNEEGGEIPPDTVLAETAWYARGWGRVSGQSVNSNTGRPTGRDELLRCSFRP
jgi:hypothetical protein